MIIIIIVFKNFYILAKPYNRFRYIVEGSWAKTPFLLILEVVPMELICFRPWFECERIIVILKFYACFFSNIFDYAKNIFKCLGFN